MHPLDKKYNFFLLIISILRWPRQKSAKRGATRLHGEDPDEIGLPNVAVFAADAPLIFEEKRLSMASIPVGYCIHTLLSCDIYSMSMHLGPLCVVRLLFSYRNFGPVFFCLFVDTAISPYAHVFSRFV